MAVASRVDAEAFKSRINCTYNEYTERCGVEGVFLRTFTRSWVNRGSNRSSQYSVGVTRREPIGWNERLGITRPSLTVAAREWHPPYESFGADMAEYRVHVIGDEIGVLASAAWHADGVMEDEKVPQAAWQPTGVGLDAAGIIDRVYEIASHIRG